MTKEIEVVGFKSAEKTKFTYPRPDQGWSIGSLQNAMMHAEVNGASSSVPIETMYGGIEVEIPARAEEISEYKGPLKHIIKEKMIPELIIWIISSVGITCTIFLSIFISINFVMMLPAVLVLVFFISLACDL